jgi:hypothetical protein
MVLADTCLSFSRYDAERRSEKRGIGGLQISLSWVRYMLSLRVYWYN